MIGSPTAPPPSEHSASSAGRPRPAATTGRHSAHREEMTTIDAASIAGHAQTRTWAEHRASATNNAASASGRPNATSNAALAGVMSAPMLSSATIEAAASANVTIDVEAQDSATTVAASESAVRASATTVHHSGKDHRRARVGARSIVTGRVARATISAAVFARTIVAPPTAAAHHVAISGVDHAVGSVTVHRVAITAVDHPVTIFEARRVMISGVHRAIANRIALAATTAGLSAATICRSAATSAMP